MRKREREECTRKWELYKVRTTPITALPLGIGQTPHPRLSILGDADTTWMYCDAGMMKEAGPSPRAPVPLFRCNIAEYGRRRSLNRQLKPLFATLRLDMYANDNKLEDGLCKSHSQSSEA